jgi:hypothetical protein
LKNHKYLEIGIFHLWFAAHDNKGKNGKVFVLDIDDIVKFLKSASPNFESKLIPLSLLFERVSRTL